MSDRLTPEERAEARALCDAATIQGDDWTRQMVALVPRLLDDLDAVEAKRAALTRSAEDVAREVLGCVPYHQPRWADGTEGESWCQTHRHTVNEWPCPEQKALADTLAAWCAERAAEVRADERAQVLAEFEWEAGACGQTKWTPGDDPLLKRIVCTRSGPHERHGMYDQSFWPVTRDRPALTGRRRLVGPWEEVSRDA